MPRRWEIKEVASHGAGITDDIKNAPPIFQAESNNIVFDFKTHNLSNRRGSKILRDANGDFDATLIAALLGFRIEQIFQLENKLLISAWSDVTSSGKIITYDERTRAVELVRTPSSRKGLDSYSTVPTEEDFEIRFETSLDKGIEGELTSTGLDAENTNHIDHMIFNIFESDTDTVVVTNYKDRINVCFVAIGYITLGSDGAITAIWGDIITALAGAGHTFTLITGTLTNDPVVLDGDMTVSNEFTRAQWGEENPSEVDADYRSSVTSLGHLQSPIYTGEAFVATEPYDKSFAVNALDVNMLDPENFKPVTERVTIKRISQYWNGTIATPQIRDAQLPAAYLGQEELPVITARDNVTDAVALYYSIFTGLIGGAVDTDDRIWTEGNGTTTCSLKFITNLGASTTIADNMKAEIDAETFGGLRGLVGIVDKAGVEWILKATSNTVNAIVIVETGYVVLEIPVLFLGVSYEVTRDGIAATPQQFINNFGTYVLGDDATYTANNPNDLLKVQANLSVPAEYKYIKFPYTMPVKEDADNTGAIDIWIDRVVGHTNGAPNTGNMPIVFDNVYARKFYLEFTLVGGGTYDGSNHVVFVGDNVGELTRGNLWQDDNEIIGTSIGVLAVSGAISYETQNETEDILSWDPRTLEPFYQVIQPGNRLGDLDSLNVRLRKVGAPLGTMNVVLYELAEGGIPGTGTAVTGGAGTINLADIGATQALEPVSGLSGTLNFNGAPITALPVGDFVLLDKLDYDNDYLDIKLNSEVSVLSGQLALVTNGTPGSFFLTGQEIIDKINLAFVEYFTRDRSSSEDWFTLYPSMGFSMEGGTDFSFETSYGLSDYYVSEEESGSIPEYHALLPIGLANKVYNYAFYLKENYTKTDDAVPKLVENNGPAAFLQVGTLSDISSIGNFVGFWATNGQGVLDPTYQVEVPLSPSVIGSVSQRFSRVGTDFFDFNDVVGVFSRTQNTGTVFYDIGETNWFIPNQLSVDDADSIFDPERWGGEDYGYFTRITDENFDRDIVANELAYFNGDVLSFQSLPQGSKYMTMVNGTAYYGSIIDNEARVFQSAPGIPSSAPRLLFSDFEDPITALNSFLEKPIVFTENKTWRLEGVKDATGVGRVFLRVISDEYGCISNQSVVKTNIGLFYWSKVGIIYTDGLRAERVSEHLLSRFQSWKAALMPNGLEIGPVGLRGAYDEVSKQIIYSGVDPASLVIANEALPGEVVEGVPNWILLDVYYGVSKSMPFYTADGPALLQENNRFKKDTFQTRVVWFSEDTLNIYRGQIGYNGDTVVGSAILTHEEDLTNDEVYETIDFPIYSPINPFYKSVALSHGQKGSRKWTSRVMINFVDLNSTGVSIQPLGWNDLNPVAHKLAPCINYQHFKEVDFSPDPDPDFPPTIIQYFKNTDTSIDGVHLISYRRRFPKGRIRNVYKQFGFEQLVQDWITLTAATVTKIANEPFSPVKVRLDTADKTFILGNGASYAKFSWSNEWYKIVEVTNDNINGGDPTYIEFIALTSRDTLTTSGIVLTEDVLIGRSPLDQSIQLSDWTMTFCRLGDRTQGLPKATELGGHT